jgi:hypothetical protein
MTKLYNGMAPQSRRRGKGIEEKKINKEERLDCVTPREDQGKPANSM